MHQHNEDMENKSYLSMLQHVIGSTLFTFVGPATFQADKPSRVRVQVLGAKLARPQVLQQGIDVIQHGCADLQQNMHTDKKSRYTASGVMCQPISDSVVSFLMVHQHQTRGYFIP